MRQYDFLLCSTIQTQTIKAVNFIELDGQTIWSIFYISQFIFSLSGGAVASWAY
jgi:hypothetical protein